MPYVFLKKKKKDHHIFIVIFLANSHLDNKMDIIVNGNTSLNK